MKIAKMDRRLRSQSWFNDRENPGMTALYLERYLNYGLTKEELTSGKPIIGIAQTGSDLSPCNRHHVELAKRVRAGIEAAITDKLVAEGMEVIDPDKAAFRAKAQPAVRSVAEGFAPEVRDYVLSKLN